MNMKKDERGTVLDTLSTRGKQYAYNETSNPNFGIG